MTTTTIKITELDDIGADLNANTLIPVVNMVGTPTTEKAVLSNVANVILSGAGTNYSPVAVATRAGTVTTAAQPNITSVGSLTGLTVSNATGTVNFTTTANVTLGAVANLRISGGTSGQYLQTDGAGNLSWASSSGSYSNSNVATYLPTFTGNVGANWILANYISGNGTSLTNIAGANVNGTVGNANLSQYLNVSDVNNNFSYHVVLSAGSGDKSLHIDADDNLQYNPADGTLTATRVDATYVLADLQYSNGYPAANVTGLGNIATINLTGSTSNVLYGNGVFAPASGGGNSSELVNGNNSFVLDGDGNVVFEGTPSGNAINRGLVWDYGANANGVNSTLRQDNGGLILRAWTENSGGANGYSAPVSIITNQDAATKAWEFDGQGNLTVPSGSINSINDGGELGAYITLTPDLGIAKLAARDAQSNVNYTNTSWTSGTYTGTQVDFTNAPDLVTFFNENQFNDGVNQTFSINGGEPLLFTGYSIGVSNAVTVYTDVTPEPDPTTVTSINFYYQLESYISVDYDDGALNVNSTGLTINIDNDQTQGPDINIRSGDDITLQAKDTLLGSEREGGDINIFAGDGGGDDGLGNISSTGGDIIIDAGVGGSGNSSSGSSGGFTQIRGGRGGASGLTSNAGAGGYVEIRGGNGGSNNGNPTYGAGGGYVSIAAGTSTQEGVNGAAVTISSGPAGPNALGGYVDIVTPSSDDGPGGTWRFDGNGNLTLPANTFAVNYANGTPVSIGGGSGNTGNVTFSNNIVIGTGDEFGGGGLYLAPGNGSIANSAVQYLRVRGGDYPTHIHLDTGNNQYYDQYFGADSRYVKLEANGNIVINADDYAGNSSTWNFDIAGNLTVPGNIQSITTGFPFTSNISGINTGNATVIVTIADSTFGDPETGQVTITGVVGTIEANGTWYFEATEANEIQLYYDQALNNPVDGTTWTAYVSGGLAVAAGYSNISITGGNVEIVTNTSNTWTFTDNGNLILAGGNSVIQSIANSSLDPVNPNVSTMVFTPDANYSSQSLVLDPTAPGHIHLRAFSPSDIDAPAANIFLGGETTAFEITSGANNEARIHSGNLTWTFSNTSGYSVVDFPGESYLRSNNDTINIQSYDTANGVGRGIYIGSSGGLYFWNGNSQSVSIQQDNTDANITAIGNTSITSNVSTWTFDTVGNLTLPTISLGSGIDEQTVISSQRKLIPPFRWSAVISGTTPTIVYTVTSVNTTSMKVTMQIQHTGLGMEFFEVFATFTGSDTYYSVGNRVAPPTIDASTVVVGLTGSNEMKITITINSGATTSWVTYDAVEFGIPND